jgi:hypothetical protein
VVKVADASAQAPEAHRQSIANRGTTLFIGAAHKGWKTDPAP